MEPREEIFTSIGRDVDPITSEFIVTFYKSISVYWKDRSQVSAD